MKKLIFAFALIFGMSFVSCNNSTSTTTDTDSVVVVDTLSIDSVCLD